MKTGRKWCSRSRLKHSRLEERRARESAPLQARQIRAPGTKVVRWRMQTRGAADLETRGSNDKIFAKMWFTQQALQGLKKDILQVGGKQQAGRTPIKREVKKLDRCPRNSPASNRGRADAGQVNLDRNSRGELSSDLLGFFANRLFVFAVRDGVEPSRGTRRNLLLDRLLRRTLGLRSASERLLNLLLRHEIVLQG